MAGEIESVAAEIEARNRRRLSESAVADWMALAEAYFGQSRNPLCVWATIRYCGEKGIALPDWVLAYLHTSAASVLEIANGPPKTAQPERCLEALGFRRPRGQESHFEDWRRWTRREPACMEFARRICSGEAYKKVRFDVAQHANVGPTTLDVWLREFFPGKGIESWSQFFRQELDFDGPRFNKVLSSLLGPHPRRFPRANSKAPGPV